jgi:hypothetical protein
VREQVELLKHHADLACSGLLLAVGGRENSVPEAHLAGLKRLEAG